MPYASRSQQAWAHTAQGTKALGGASKVHEWDEATKRAPGGFKALPSKTGSSRALLELSARKA